MGYHRAQAGHGVSLPEGIDPEAEIALTWERNDDIVKVTASLDDATIVVDSQAGSDASHVLVHALPAIMNTAYEAINSQEDS